VQTKPTLGGAVTARDEYHIWPSLPDLFPVWFPGLDTGRDDVVVDIGRSRLIERMKREGRFRANNLQSCCHGPFDLRWLYRRPQSKPRDKKGVEYWGHVHEDQGWIVMQRKPRREWSAPLFTTVLGCVDVMGRSAGFFPMYLQPKRGIGTLPGSEADQPGTLNLSRRAFAVVSEIGTAGPVLFYHTLAILHSPNYRREHGAALRQDWPRVMIPATKEDFVDSADLGFRIAVELAIEWEWETYAEVPRPGALDALAGLSREGGDALDPDGRDLEVTAGWGRAGKAGTILPGRGRVVEREYTEEERSAMGSVIGQLGETTFDVYLNDCAYWKNIPSRVWGYTLGGYQVIKKWLSYRERGLLGRPLTVEDTRHVQEMARRIGGILLMEPALDANYDAVKRSPYPWTRTGLPST
jgi:hypothetical protein